MILAVCLVLGLCKTEKRIYIYEFFPLSGISPFIPGYSRDYQFGKTFFFFFLKKELFCHNMFMLVFVQGQCGDIECFVSHVKPYIFMSVHAHDMPVSCNMYACK